MADLPDKIASVLQNITCQAAQDPAQKSRYLHISVPLPQGELLLNINCDTQLIMADLFHEGSYQYSAMLAPGMERAICPMFKHT
jgi:hypothetical protein